MKMMGRPVPATGDGVMKATLLQRSRLAVA
jgi:hypothetical protein